MVIFSGECPAQSVPDANNSNNEKFVKDLGGITVDVKEVSLDSVMKEVLEGTGLRYRIQDRIIL